MVKDFYTVGIGASAGGLHSLRAFFDHIPGDMDVAFVVITHLARDHKSVLAELLETHTMMQVVRVEKDVRLEPGKIYVLIENTKIEVKDGILKVSMRDKAVINASVDIFLESLALDFKEKAVGIILSGGGRDGLKGAKAIDAAGGIVLVEDPRSAEVDGMPNSIINFDHPREILRPAELAENLVRRCILHTS